MEELISPTVQRGGIVILDRYYFSSMAYQGARGIDPTEIRRQNEAFAPQPDLLVILDLDVDVALKRIALEMVRRMNLKKRKTFSSAEISS